MGAITASMLIVHGIGKKLWQQSDNGLIRTFGAGQQAKSFPSGNVLSFGGHGTSPKPFESGLTSA